MAISIDWATSVITVQKSDMVLIQSSPSEIYQLDMDVFRQTLNDLQDDEEGIAYPTTHNHNPPVSVSGAVLARVVEILAPYTVTFEDDQYRVQVVGANTNIGERTNVNQVSVSTSNSAGLQDLNSLQAASFGQEVSLDVTSAFSGTTFPIGTGGNPVNNLADAYAIAESRGIHRIKIYESMTFSGSDFSEGYEFEGVNASAVTVTINPSSEVSNCTFKNLTVQGTLDNANIIRECSILNILNINGFIFQCALAGTITLGGGAQSTIMSCYSGVAGGGNTPIIDMGGSGQALLLRDYSGGVKITNKTGTDAVSLDLTSGQVIIDSTVTAGDITVRGVGKITNNSTGSAVVVEELLTSANLNKAAFVNGCVYLDTSSSDAGTAFPIGSVGRPVNNLTDALSIANAEGLRCISMKGFVTATAAHNLDNIKMTAASGSTNILYLNGCSTQSSDFERLIIYGALDGLARINNCVLGDSLLGNLTEVEGRIVDCIINSPTGVVQKTAGAGTLFDNCSFLIPNYAQVTLDLNGKSFSMRNCTGNVLITNKTDAETNEVHMLGGLVEFAASCTAGSIIVEGNASVTDNSTGTAVIQDDTVTNDTTNLEGYLANLYAITLANKGNTES